MTRHEQRQEAFLIVFEHSFSGESADEIILNAEEGRELKIAPFAYQLAKNTIEKIEVLDEYVEKFSTKWKKNRLSRVSLSVLRLALYEMLYEESIPESVSINEAVELAKKFGGEEDSAFVNGLLGAVSRSDKKLAAEEE
ncbi:MAG: transcription antitermination factor NusB [Oscillospiraceae bacterium]|nr:transcription antitermination factor NusB [Oscillospiraceae bacterium]MBQ7082602.1 transcription antitermination factor NusB [Oscillospiraceae bacterium]MBR2635620.1 transcription antitermination factor NusB [Oscillospiraceae bacterium]MBR6608452.1 transcription antitermination factor NusB [Oscillospiraceae bacterium]